MSKGLLSDVEEELGLLVAEELLPLFTGAPAGFRGIFGGIIGCAMIPCCGAG
jgi:hypothetical protein